MSRRASPGSARGLRRADRELLGLAIPALGALFDELTAADPAADLLFSLELYIGALARAVDRSN